jgi:deoxyribonucleoside regulator
MKKDRDFYVQVARRYYLDELSQAEVAVEFGISRPTVSNILKECRDTGIVDIRIENTSSSLSMATAQRLKTTFNLKHVEVVPTELGNAQTLKTAGIAAGKLLRDNLHNEIRIGMSWGTSLFQVVSQLPKTEFIGAEVIQMVGALEAGTNHTDSFELARELSRKLNGTYRTVQAPIVVRSLELKEMLMEEPGIGAVVDRMDEIEIALVGISSNVPETSALVRAGFLTSAESDEILAQGGIGHYCGYHFNAEGEILDIPWNGRIVGIDPKGLVRIPHVIGVACGAEKAAAILAMLRGGHLNSLVTDEAAALRILSSI